MLSSTFDSFLKAEPTTHWVEEQASKQKITPKKKSKGQMVRCGIIEKKKKILNWAAAFKKEIHDFSDPKKYFNNCFLKKIQVSKHHLAVKSWKSVKIESADLKSHLTNFCSFLHFNLGLCSFWGCNKYNSCRFPAGCPSVFRLAEKALQDISDSRVSGHTQGERSARCCQIECIPTFLKNQKWMGKTEDGPS